jgi:diaminohydroxyphosphoribosylaminopyrimidine deaminase/5-amino-6-(5-phosphoribosylamino)uracil reductase
VSAANREVEFSAGDYAHMARALQLGARGMYSTRPNPRVGCIIVNRGEIVGEGWHQRAGEPHAEVHALQQAGNGARDATCYVTLEPCCHHGRTPPCSTALVQSGVSRVVAAMLDPNPKVAGGGFAELNKAGVSCASGLLAAQAEELNIGFAHRMRNGRPWIRAKLGMSLDGRIAMASGQSQWITGETARADVQRWRARSCAIVTGIGTVLRDDPALTVRAPELVGTIASQPLRVVIDSHRRMPATARMLNEPGQTLVFGLSPNAEQCDKFEFISCAESQGHVDLKAAMQALGQRGVNEVLVEAGPTLTGALMQAGLIDELICFVAPRLLGDAAQAMMKFPGLERLEDSVRMQWVDMQKLQDDLRLILRPMRT